MTNNPLPAALASIKRYSIVAYDGENGPHWEYREHPAGEFCFFDKVEKLFATMPPPADGARAWLVLGVAWGKQIERCSVDKEKAQIIADTLIDGQVLPLYAAPPADSAIVEALKECIKTIEGACHTSKGYPRAGDEYTRAIEVAEHARTQLAGRK